MLLGRLGGGDVGGRFFEVALVLLERAFNGTEKAVRRGNGSEDRMREYSGQLALYLLQDAS